MNTATSALPVGHGTTLTTRNAPLIEIQHLSLHYGTKAVLKDITLPLATGRITCLVGPSGVGKSSLLACLNRLTDLTPSARVSGSVRLHGRELLAPRIDVVALRRRVGMIFQKPNPFPLSVWNNLAVPLKEHGIKNKQERTQRIETALRDVGLWPEVKDRLHRSALALSGGQQQRLCIARALVLRPQALLLDEPCSALDPLATAVIEELMLTLRGRYTLAVVTHNLAQARRIADYAALLWPMAGDGVGRLMEHGPGRVFFEAPRHALTAAYVRGERG
ncbi:MAG TPA: phosphate ABC transporter ATP-binding protein [Gammaproteobacteria bacterium]|nr:phosphate ABC transporter ATP-binding protein [Gammaproteobacteria bacterium]